ncbi:hypothetical protein Tco_0460435, partial [Tanacetum coccineum]
MANTRVNKINRCQLRAQTSFWRTVAAKNARKPKRVYSFCYQCVFTVGGVESDLVDSFEEGEIRDDSVLYNDGCIKDCMEKNLEDDAGEILGVHSQGD